MRQIEPKFDYPHNPNHGNSQGNDSQGKTQSAWKVGPLRGNNNPLTDMNPLQGPESVVIRHENKQTPPPPPPKKAKKYGSSLGWGWFQAFSLFLTLLFLVGSGILLWMMIGNESIHEGPPKYVLSNDGQVGDVVLNPQLVGSMVAGDPKNMNQRPGQNEQILNDPLKSKTVANTGVGNIELLGESESDKVTATPTSQKSEKEQQADDIASLLASGANALKEVKLTTPEDDSAYFYYSQVLAIAPDNPTAQAGILEIAKRYANLVSRDLERGEIERAKKYLEIGLKLDPVNEQLLEFKYELDAYSE